MTNCFAAMHEILAEESGGQLAMRKIQPRWILVVLLFFGLGINMIHRTSLSIAGSAILKDFTLNTAQMGWLLSAFFWPYSILQIPAGWLVDRIGVRKLYAASFAIWSVACASTAIVSGFWSSLATRVVLGIGQAAIFPASIRAIASWFTDKQRATAVAIFSTGSRFGLIVLPIVGAWLISHWGWRIFFLVVGLAPMIWLLAWHKFYVRFPEQPSPEDFSQSVETRGKHARTASMLDLVGNRNVWGICLGYFAYDYVWYLYIAWLPGYLMLERGYALGQAGMYAALPMSAMSIVIPGAGLASDWLVRRGYSEIAVRKTFLCLGLLLACAMVPAGLAVNAFVSVLWLTFALAGLGLAAPNTWALTMKISPPNSVGVLSGVQNFAGNIGGVLAPLITGYIAHITGSFSLALGFASVVSFAGMLAYLFLCHVPDSDPGSTVQRATMASSIVRVQ